MIQWLGLGTFIAMGLDLIPGQVTKILQATWCSKKKKKVGDNVNKRNKQIGNVKGELNRKIYHRETELRINLFVVSPLPRQSSANFN